jgi:hypothetical protein
VNNIAQKHGQCVFSLITRCDLNLKIELDKSLVLGSVKHCYGRAASGRHATLTRQHQYPDTPRILCQLK